MKAKNALQDFAQSNRRDLLGTGAAIATGLSAGMLSSASTGDVAAQKSATGDETESVQGLMPWGNLGRTGARVAIFGPGGQGGVGKSQSGGVSHADDPTHPRVGSQLFRHICHL